MSNQYQPYPPYDPYPKQQAPYPPPQPPLPHESQYQPGAPPPYNYATAPPPHNYATAPSQPMGSHQNPYSNPSDPFFSDQMQGFSDVKIRHAFIRKVFSILTIQLAITIGFILLFHFVEPVNGFFVANSWILYVCIAGTFVFMIVLACCDSVARQYPLNMILLFAFTILESILLAAICARTDFQTVMIAMGITAAIVVSLVIFSMQTKYDFTGAGIYLFVALLLLLIFGIISAIIRSKILSIFYAAIGAGIFSMYIIFDTQLMLGGKHKYSISPEDYIMATLSLYLDIINLFLMILRLVSAARN